MKQFDFGYHGEPDLNTDFFCFVTDILVDGKLVVLSEEGERAIIGADQFTCKGNLKDYIASLTHESETHAVGGKLYGFTTYAFETVFSTIHHTTSLLNGYLQVLTEIHENLLENAPLVFHPSPAFLSSYVTLVKCNKQPETAYFTVGHTYEIYRGCLLDENGECYADQISSVEQLNQWEDGDLLWREEHDYEQRNKEVFEDTIH